MYIFDEWNFGVKKNWFWGKNEIWGKKMKFGVKIESGAKKKLILGQKRIKFGVVKNNVHSLLKKLKYLSQNSQYLEIQIK
jgi:hypothetical protein